MSPRENYKNITMLEDLPELQDLTPQKPQYTGAQHLPTAEVDRYKKFIRNGHIPLQESGMFPRSLQQIPEQESLLAQSPYMNESTDVRSKYGLSNSPSCLEVADHIANCPICSKFYNTDKTLHIVIIALLAIICIILLKKILNV